MFEGSPPVAGLFLCASGSIRTMMSSPVSSSVADKEEYASAANILTYLLYALDQPEWFKQYYDQKLQKVRKFVSEVKKLEKQQRRSHLHVIDGGKSEEKKHE